MADVGFWTLMADFEVYTWPMFDFGHKWPFLEFGHKWPILDFGH